MIDILYLCYNRISATRITLPALLERTDREFELYIYNNGSTDYTHEYLEKVIKNFNNGKINTKCKHIKYIRWHKNKGIAAATNDFWFKAKNEIFGKIDNDIIVFEGWAGPILKVLEKFNNAGPIGHCHFFPHQPGFKDINKGKCIEKDGISFHPIRHIGGNYLIKKDVVKQFPPMNIIKKGRMWKVAGWTERQWAMTKKGFTAGYVRPLRHWEHLIKHGDDAYYMETRGFDHARYKRWLG